MPPRDRVPVCLFLLLRKRAATEPDPARYEAMITLGGDREGAGKDERRTRFANL